MARMRRALWTKSNRVALDRRSLRMPAKMTMKVPAMLTVMLTAMLTARAMARTSGDARWLMKRSYRRPGVRAMLVNRRQRVRSTPIHMAVEALEGSQCAQYG